MVRTRTAKQSYPKAMISRINAPTTINQGNGAQNLKFELTNQDSAGGKTSLPEIR